MLSFKNNHLSYSRLSRFEQCPLSFKLHYIDGQSAEPGIALKFGKAVHAVLLNPNNAPARLKNFEGMHQQVEEEVSPW